MKQIVGFMKDERGDFIQNGLWIVIVILLVAGASVGFAGSLKTKFEGITDSVDATTVPTTSGE